MKNFYEVCVYKVKPTKVAEFEELILEIDEFQQSIPGSLEMEFIKRTHRITNFESIRQGIPPKKITRIIKSVKYIMYWKMDNEETHGKATQLFFEKFGKKLSRCTLEPGEKYLGVNVL